MKSKGRTGRSPSWSECSLETVRVWLTVVFLRLVTGMIRRDRVRALEMMLWRVGKVRNVERISFKTGSVEGKSLRTLAWCWWRARQVWCEFSYFFLFLESRWTTHRLSFCKIIHNRTMKSPCSSSSSPGSNWRRKCARFATRKSNCFTGSDGIGGDPWQ